MPDVISTNQTIVVVGGGISGMTAAIEAAECGKEVILLEKMPSVGGRVTQLYKYFPKLCFPACGMEINLRRIKAATSLRVITLAEVESVRGEAGNYTLTVKLTPRFTNQQCTACGECTKVVTAEFADEHHCGLKTRKGVYLPHPMAYPQQYVIDSRIIGTDDARQAKTACKYSAIDLDMQTQTIQFKAGAIIWATGWQPYDAAKIQPYGYGRFANVVTSVEFERMMDPFGPTGGQMIRPSDGKPARNVAFIQCAGSRDQNHLKHCSRICCMASLKQTTYVREKFGDDAASTIYYIDIHAIDRLDDFYQKIQADETVKFIKSKVANIVEDSKTGDVVLHGVDVEGYHRYANAHDLCVLAIGMEPSVPKNSFPVQVKLNAEGFIEQDPSNGAIFAAGCASDALDVSRAVQSATAAALRAIQVVNKVARAEG